MIEKIYISKVPKYHIDTKNGLEIREFEKLNHVNDVVKFKKRPFKNSIQVLIKIKD
jgi:hypothetical protein